MAQAARDLEDPVVRGTRMPSESPSIGNTAWTRMLCAVIVVVMIVAALYTAWIAISNFSRIGV